MLYLPVCCVWLLFYLNNLNIFSLWLAHSVLSENNFFGAIPKEFGRLQRLEVLDLTDNNLSGRIPAEIGNLYALRSLWVHNLIVVHVKMCAAYISLYCEYSWGRTIRKILLNCFLYLFTGWFVKTTWKEKFHLKLGSFVCSPNCNLTKYSSLLLVEHAVYIENLHTGKVLLVLLDLLYSCSDSCYIYVTKHQHAKMSGMYEICI